MTSRTDSSFITRVVLKNYRSIAACDVGLGPLTFLVGPNGSGKSNFLDALRFIGDSLRTSLDHALRDRGGVNEVRRRSGGHPTNFGIKVEFVLPDGIRGHLAFEVGAVKEGGFDLKKEECFVGAARYLVENGEVVEMTAAVSPPPSRDRLYLVTAAGLPEFRAAYDALSTMGFYNLNPDRLRDLQPPDKGDLLARDGRNLASTLDRLARGTNGASEAKKRIEEYLAKVVPGIEGVDAKKVGHMETLEFRQRIEGQRDAWRFPAINMSDGTLRALGTLVALFQHAAGGVPLVGIEEPEIALHPAAAGVLFDALRDASRDTQVIVTSHSPDLLDHKGIQVEQILAVVATDGRTEVATVDAAGRDALRQGLYTPGELLRLDQLRPDDVHVQRLRAKQLDLFEKAAG
jgi:predicted ATPase